MQQVFVYHTAEVSNTREAHSLPEHVNDREKQSERDLEQMSKEGLPNTITFLPHRTNRNIARVYRKGLNDRFQRVLKGCESVQRELANPLLWATLAIILCDDSPNDPVHKADFCFAPRARANDGLQQQEKSAVGLRTRH